MEQELKKISEMEEGKEARTSSLYLKGAMERLNRRIRRAKRLWSASKLDMGTGKQQASLSDLILTVLGEAVFCGFVLSDNHKATMRDDGSRVEMYYMRYSNLMQREPNQRGPLKLSRERLVIIFSCTFDPGENFAEPQMTSLSTKNYNIDIKVVMV